MIDIHNHTIFSDGKDSMADVIQAAVERELKVVGISDHFDPYLLRQDVCLQPEGVNSYLREIERLKGSYPITVLSGLELGLQSTGISWPVGDFDYYIYSVHTVPGFPDLRDMEDPWDIYLEEAAMAVELIDKPGFLGHLDFLRRHIPGSKPPSPGELMDILLKQIIALQRGIGVQHVGLDVQTGRSYSPAVGYRKVSRTWGKADNNRFGLSQGHKCRKVQQRCVESLAKTGGK